MFFLDKLQLKVLPDTPEGVLLAQEVFTDEIRLRSGVMLSQRTDGRTENLLVIDTIDRVNRLMPELSHTLAGLPIPGKEGFQLGIDRQHNTLVVAGTDARGCMYGMGKVLRKAMLTEGSARLIDGFDSLARTPKYAIRGHQYGYRDKQNTCPVWTDEDFDRYVRDMVIFGNNAVELMPPRTDDALFSPAFPQDPMVTLEHWSRIAHSYGMDVWLWYPNMGKDYNLPETRRTELLEREEIFSRVPYIDAVLIPTGDPGKLEPRQFFEVAGESMRVLHRHHPDAKVFVSPQGFKHQGGDYEAFYEEVSKQPDWLYGLCYAPWNRDTIAELQDQIPVKYRDRIRHYPDITHNSASQFEVPEWDIAFALSQGREGYTSRPKAMKHIHNMHAPFTMGSLTYSEGIHDDVNKIVWADQDFDPAMSTEESLQDYVRYLISPDLTEELSVMLAALEDNWVGDIETNQGIDRLYEQFRAMEAKVSEQVRNNYRFKMPLLRAISDYQTKQRAIHDRALQKEAENVLAQAELLGANRAVYEARNILNRSHSEPVVYELTQEMFRLAEELFRTPGCRIKLSSKLLLGQSWIRGAWLDCAHMPLNDYQWYTVHFKRIEALFDEQEKLDYIHELLHRTDPGPGGQYLCLGEIDTFKKYVVSPLTWEQDPGFLRSPAVAYDLYGIVFEMHAMRKWHNEFPVTINWLKRVRALYFTPLVVCIPDLCPDAGYRLRVTYSELIKPDSRINSMESTLHAGDILLHHKVQQSGSFDHTPVYEYLLPREAYKEGSITLTWRATGSWRSVSVSELWIEKIQEVAE